MIKYTIFFWAFILQTTLIYGQDTLVGWTFPEGRNNPLSDIGNVLNKGGMYLEVVNTNGMPFTTLGYTYSGYTSSAASSDKWEDGKEKKSWKVSCDATGYEKMKVYCRISSCSINPGPREFFLQYRLGCCSPVWKNVSVGILIVDTTWNMGAMVGIDIPEDAKNMSGLQLQWVCASDTATDGNPITSAGVSLIDDIIITGEKISSVNDLFLEGRTNVYPNPTEGIIRVKSSYDRASYYLTNTLGIESSNGILQNSETEIDLTELPQGVYYLTVYYQNNIEVLRIIKK